MAHISTTTVCNFSITTACKSLEEVIFSHLHVSKACLPDKVSARLKNKGSKQFLKINKKSAKNFAIHSRVRCTYIIREFREIRELREVRDFKVVQCFP